MADSSRVLGWEWHETMRRLFEIVIDSAAERIILGAPVRYPSINVSGEDEETLLKIARDLPQNPLETIDKMLFYVLYKRESLLLRHPDERERIRELTKIVSEFSGYRERIMTKGVHMGLTREEMEKRIYDGIDRLVVLLTHSCQLRCEYCRVRKFEAEMDEAVMLRSIDLLFTSSKKDLQLQFFGGEPLLRFGMIKKAVAYGEELEKEYGKKLTFILTTNGIALTEDKLSYMKQHNFLVEFSFDGSMQTQLKTRKSSTEQNYYPVIEQNLKNTLKSGIPFYTISVVTPETVHELYDNFVNLIKIGSRRIQINYSLGFYWRPAETKKLMEQFGKIMAFAERNKELGIGLVNAQKTRKEPVVLNAELSVDCDGTIYLESGICLEQDFQKMKNKFGVVDIKSASNINKLSSTRFGNFYRLVSEYSEHKPEFRKVVLNNIELGNLMGRIMKDNIAKSTHGDSR